MSLPEGPSVSARRWGLWLVLALGLVAPRMVRMAAPLVHYEDDNYLYSAYLIHRGEQPYRDFVQANPPLLEQFAAPFFTLFGPTHRVGEGLTAAALLATALALWRIGGGLYADRSGAVAAVLYSWMPLVFRYHLFEREVYSLCASACGAALALGVTRPGRGRLLAAGVVCGLAFHCKQVGLFPGLALVVYLLGRSGIGPASWAALGALVSGAGLLGLDYLWYGPDLLLQSFALHLIKGAPLPFDVRVVRLLEEIGPFVPLALLGAWIRRKEASTLFLLLWVALELAFMLVLSSTFWPHYMIPLLGPLVVLSGGALASGRRSAVVALVAALAGLGLQASGAPARRLGFSGLDRLELAQAAAQIQKLVPPDSRELLCPPILALEADRIKRFNYIDTLGFTRQLQAAYREGRLRGLLAGRPQDSFSGTLGRANATWLPEALEALQTHRIQAVVPEGELPIRPAALVSFGYAPVFRGRELVVYALASGGN